MKRRYKLAIILLIITIFLISPLFQFIKAFAVMAIYSKSEASYSLMKKENIELFVPDGWSTFKKDWFPFLMTFNDDAGFSRYIGKDVKLSILYNFGAFEYLKGASSYYNKDSPYFDAFYGAYAVKGSDFIFGYNNDLSPDYNEMAKVPEYDMKVLVLESIGCNNSTFDFNIDSTYKKNEFLGYNNWDVIEATITTNSPMHSYKNNYQAYIQYGKPPKSLYTGEDFPLVTVKGKIYARYFEEKKCTIFLYVIAPNVDSVNQCDVNFLQKSKISIN